MKRLYRLYIFSVSGALGGIVAAWLHQQFFVDTLVKALSPSTRYLYLAYLGGVIGLPIGFLPTFIEGRGNYSLRGAIRVGLTGAVLGGMSGAIALPLAEWVHLWLGGGMRGRVSAWVLFASFVGVFVGIAEGRVGGARPWRGIFGGVAGGALTGIVLELLLGGSAPPPGDAARAQAAAEAVGVSSKANDSAILALLLLGFFVARHTVALVEVGDLDSAFDGGRVNLRSPGVNFLDDDLLSWIVNLGDDVEVGDEQLRSRQDDWLALELRQVDEPADPADEQDRGQHQPQHGESLHAFTPPHPGR